MSKLSSNLRMTDHRDLVLNVLRSTQVHPTAQDVFLLAREFQPHIGIATVYRILDWLVRHNLAQEVYRDKDGAAHYDADTTHHDHAICTGCGYIMDVTAPPPALAYTSVENETGFHVNWQTTTFFGVCASCA